MEILLLSFVFVFVFGLIIGSFLNVLILRWNIGQSLDGRSGCVSCEKKLSWYELIPVFSYLSQLGRCRGCKKKISIQYPIVEIITGIVFVLGASHVIDTVTASGMVEGILSWKVGISLISLLATLSILVAIFVYDLYHKIIPDRWSLAFAISSLVYSLSLYSWTESFNDPKLYIHILSGLILFLPFYLLWKVSNGTWIGLGDGKLAVGIGFLLGLLPGMSAIVFSFWIGAAFAILIMLISRLELLPSRITMKSELPFGPFMIISTLIVLLTGISATDVINWLSNLFI